MLQDHNVLANIWPDVPREHHDMFGYLNVEFDLHESKVTIETAAKGFSGSSIKKKEYNVKGEFNIESKPKETSTPIEPTINQAVVPT